MKCTACNSHDYEGHTDDCPWTLLEESSARAEKAEAEVERLEEWIDRLAIKIDTLCDGLLKGGGK